jgi:hypothetical protein
MTAEGTLRAPTEKERERERERERDERERERLFRMAKHTKLINMKWGMFCKILYRSLELITDRSRHPDVLRQVYTG